MECSSNDNTIAAVFLARPPFRWRLGPAARRGSVPFRLLIDGLPPSASHGSDIDAQGRGKVTDQRLYQLIRQSGPIADGQFEIEFLDSGVEAFAFTFG
jgi:hypothetical protein